MSSVPAFDLNLNEPFPHLPRAPIIEAVIEWKARAKSLPSGDELRNKLLELLPEYSNVNELRRHRMLMAIGPEGRSEQTTTTDGQHGLRLTSPDQSRIVHITKDGILFSRLPPYPGWDGFISEGLRLWQVYLQLAAPEEVNRLGVRFINRLGAIDLTGLGHYLTKPPVCLDSVGIPIDDILFQSLHKVPGLPLQINVRYTVQPSASSQESGNSLILDIDVFTSHGFATTDETLLQERLQQLRWLKDKAFFSLVQPGIIDSYRQERP